MVGGEVRGVFRRWGGRQYEHTLQKAQGETEEGREAGQPERNSLPFVGRVLGHGWMYEKGGITDI